MSKPIGLSGHLVEGGFCALYFALSAKDVSEGFAESASIISQRALRDKEKTKYLWEAHGKIFVGFVSCLNATSMLLRWGAKVGVIVLSTFSPYVEVFGSLAGALASFVRGGYQSCEIEGKVDLVQLKRLFSVAGCVSFAFCYLFKGLGVLLGWAPFFDACESLLIYGFLFLLGEIFISTALPTPDTE